MSKKLFKGLNMGSKPGSWESEIQVHTQRCLPFEILEELAQTPSLTLCPHLSLPLRVSSAEEIRGQRASLRTFRASFPHGQAQTLESTPFLRAPPLRMPAQGPQAWSKAADVWGAGGLYHCQRL